MALVSLLYGSTSTVPVAERDRAIGDIVHRSQEWNLAHAITGVLLFAGDRFAQLLEGEERDVRVLMERIDADPRHRDVRVVVEDHDVARRVPGWSLAYAGPSSFVSGRIAPLLTDTQHMRRAAAARRLIDLMIEFTRDGTRQQMIYRD